MYYPEEVIEEVRTRNDIVDIVSQYVNLKKKGANYFGLCPFHNEKSPSFSVSPGKQMYYCFGCGAGGNVITFVMEYENYTFVEAVKMLADRAGIALPEVEYSKEARAQADLKNTLLEINRLAANFFYYQLKQPSGKVGYDYFKEKRRLTDDTIRHFGLGYSSKVPDDLYRYMRSKGYNDDILKETGLFFIDERGARDKFWNRVMFPILDVNNRVIGFGGRVMGDGEPKYLNSPETKLFDKSRNLYGLNYARLSREGYLLICEGYLDVISLHQAGFTNAVASLGTAFTSQHANVLKRYTDQVILTYDSDGAGVKAALRAIPILKEVGMSIKVLNMKPYKDPDEFIKKYGRERFAMLLDGSADPTEFQLKKAAANYDLRDSAGRLNYLKDAIDILARKGVTPTARDVYAGRLAEETGVGKKAILEQMNDVLRSTQRRDRRKEQRDLAGQGNAADIRVPYSAGGDAALGAASAGRQLIAALLQSPEKIPYVRQRLNMDAVALPEMQEALRAIFRCADEQLPVNITSLQQMLDDKPMAEVNRAQAVNAGHPLQQKDIDMYLERLDNAKPISQTVKGTTDDQFLSAFSKLRKEKGAADPPQSD